MADGANRLIQAVGGLFPRTGPELSFGVVERVDPLTIIREYDKAQITEEFLILSKTCKRLELITAVHEHDVSAVGTEPELSDSLRHGHTVPAHETRAALQRVLIWPALRAGERVILLSFNQDQRFFVERLEKWEGEA